MPIRYLQSLLVQSRTISNVLEAKMRGNLSWWYSTRTMQLRTGKQ